MGSKEVVILYDQSFWTSKFAKIMRVRMITCWRMYMTKKKVICDKHVQHEVVIFKADTSMFPETVGVILRMVCSRRPM